MMDGMRKLIAALTLPLVLAACGGQAKEKAGATTASKVAAVSLVVRITDTTRVGIFDWEGGSSCKLAGDVQATIRDGAGEIVGTTEPDPFDEVPWDKKVGCVWTSSPVDLPAADFYDIAFSGTGGDHKTTWQRNGESSGTVTYTAG